MEKRIILQDDSENASGGSMVNVVANEIRRGIQERIYKPGDKITEMGLCKQYGTSRTPVREAFRLLQQEGLLIHIPHCGVQVVSFGEKEMFDVLEARTAVECLSSRLAAPKAVKEHIEQLRDINRRIMEVQPGDKKNTSLLDEEFHMVIASIGENDCVYELLKSIFVKNRITTYILPIKKERLPHTYKEHEDIICALEQNDPEMAEKYTSIHFHYSIKSNRKKIQEAKENHII